MKPRPVLWRALIALAVLALSSVVALTTAPTLGLDLRGGTQIVLETRDTPEVAADGEGTDRVLEVLRGRVDGLIVMAPQLDAEGLREALPGLNADTYGVALGDMNGDGRLDIVFANSDASNQILLGLDTEQD